MRKRDFPKLMAELEYWECFMQSEVGIPPIVKEFYTLTSTSRKAYVERIDERNSEALYGGLLEAMKLLKRKWPKHERNGD